MAFQFKVNGTPASVDAPAARIAARSGFTPTIFPLTAGFTIPNAPTGAYAGPAEPVAQHWDALTPA
jgi:hypothetical protein